MLAHDLPNILPRRCIFSPLTRGSMETGVATYPLPMAGTTDGATHIQTPSRAEHGPEGVLLFQILLRQCLRNRSPEKLVS